MRVPCIATVFLLDYAVQLPSLNSSRNGSLGQQGADVDWILAGAGARGNSARSMRLEDLESSSRQSSASLDGRRYLSAGKKSKLPWDDNQVRMPAIFLRVRIFYFVDSGKSVSDKKKVRLVTL